MRFIGIDPGFDRCGFGILDKEGSRLTVVTYGCITTKKDQTYGERILTVYNDLMHLIKIHKPDVAGVERLFFSKNATSAFQVGEARGIIMLSLLQNSVSVLEFNPLQIKQAVTGYGRADKQQVGQMVKSILKLTEIPTLDDTSDALACAITAAFVHI